MNRLLRVFILLLSAALFVGAGVASADTFQFILQGPASFTFEVSTPVSPQADPGFGFTLTPGTQVTGLPSGDFVTFYNGAFGGGFSIFANASTSVAYPFGQQLYSGPETNPTSFLAGGPPLTLLDGNAAGNPPAFTLTIKNLSSVSTPEPSVTILLAIGLLALGLTAFRFKPNFGVSAN